MKNSLKKFQDFKLSNNQLINGGWDYRDCLGDCEAGCWERNSSIFMYDIDGYSDCLGICYGNCANFA